MRNTYIIGLITGLTVASSFGKTVSYNFPLKNGCDNYSPAMMETISKIKAETSSSDNVVLRFSEGKYIFREEGTFQKDYFISNHDQTNPRKIVMDFSGINNLTIEGGGAEFLMEGRMLPIVATKCRNLSLTNFSIDFLHPQIIQMEIAKNMGDEGIVSYLAPWVQYDIDKDGHIINCGEGWRNTPEWGTVFDDKRHIAYRISDITIDTKGSDTLEDRVIESPFWKDSRLETGMTIIGRTYERPYPGIFLANSKDTHIENVTIHYAEGMGIIAQYCENITLEGLKVIIRRNSNRLFTTQADATHFSGCKGKITSKNGTYENMMDDAINVHGTYLKVTEISQDRKILTCKYMHEQSWGFGWGEKGDSVQLISSSTMDVLHRATVNSISADQENKTFVVELSQPVQNIEENMGLENTTWYPEVEFSGNTIRNNRARGALFSTPRKVVVENNLFSNISGCAILLCGDCNGWFESGSCRDILIKGNRFIDVLTSPFQFTEAIISIYPVIPEIDKQKGYFHSGIKIESNYFETFDRPVVFAISVNGLVFKKNLIYGDTRFKPYHENKYSFNFQRVQNYNISGNTFSGYKYSEKEDILSR